MMSIGQALVQITIGVNLCFSISNPLFPLFHHHSLAHYLAYRLSIARYCLRLLTVLLIIFHMCCTLGIGLIHHHPNFFYFCSIKVVFSSCILHLKGHHLVLVISYSIVDLSIDYTLIFKYLFLYLVKL
jgi:hypothetical protein